MVSSELKLSPLRVEYEVFYEQNRKFHNSHSIYHDKA